MRQFLISCLVLFALAFVVMTANAYTLRHTDSSGAVRVRWPSNTITVTLSSSLLDPPANIKATSNELQAALINALRRWEKAANINFIINNSARLSVSLSDKGDTINLISVSHTVDNLKFFSGRHSRDIARTRTLHDDNGALLEADIALNPAHLFSSDGTPGTYDLEATFIHEVGHLLGLGESSVLGASMSPRQGWNGLYHCVAWSGRSLSADDISGLTALYGSRPEAENTGTIFGNLTWPGGQPAFGVNVWAEEWKSGRVVASSITLSKGEFRLEGLRQGLSYRLVAGSLTGLLTTNDFAGSNAGLAGLLGAESPSFFSEELKLVTISGGTVYVAKQLRTPNTKSAHPTLIGLNNELADVSLTLTAGQNYRILLSGENLFPEQLLGVVVESPYLFVAKNSIKIWEEKRTSGILTPTISFFLEVSANAPVGDYSLRVETADGSIVIPGVLSVEATSFARTLPAGSNERRVKTTSETKAAINHFGSHTLLSSISDGLLEDDE